jgi:hypothetical protein
LKAVFLRHSRVKDLAYTTNVNGVCGKFIVYSENNNKSTIVIRELHPGVYKGLAMVHSVTTMFVCDQYYIKVFQTLPFNGKRIIISVTEMSLYK